VFNRESKTNPKPGQFVMIWAPGVDEVPMSISSYNEKGEWSITVKNVGECTNALHELTIGDYIGVRGPLGNFFQIPQDKNKKIFLIGGGIGMVPLRFLASELVKLGHKFTIIEGAKVENDLIFMDEFFDLNREGSEFNYCTDDGSYGEKGLITEIFENALKDLRHDEFKNTIIYTCGPEIMMYKLLQTCNEHDIEMHASLERIMRCGCGLCGLCALDPIGSLVCKDGPIFSSELLKKMDDFGKHKREFSGKKISQ
jgi:dihydroorotate dehydrogenase electron transfer subunit